MSACSVPLARDGRSSAPPAHAWCSFSETILYAVTPLKSAAALLASISTRLGKMASKTPL
eukprot:3336916-Pleurochrysis_carterae.AAC.1